MTPLGLNFEPYVIDAASGDPLAAYRALASAASSYLSSMEHAIAEGVLPQRVALHTRVRGTGPRVAFGKLIERVEKGIGLEWSSPFEGSHNVSGAELPARNVLGEDRHDGFLFLRFAEETQDLPLHIHPTSDRFIYVIGGRGFFHVTDAPLQDVAFDQLQHVPARDRDVFMFRRGTVHTFSTGESPLMLLSYHRPFLSLNDPDQFHLGSRVLLPQDFLRGAIGKVSFDAAWNVCKMFAAPLMKVQP